VKVRVGARTDVGRVREGNEDSYMVHDPLYAVADGMGGHQGGEVASSTALEHLERIAEEPISEDSGSARLADVVREANRVVYEKAAGDPGLSGMGTTLTAVVAAGPLIHLAHVGDSRAYLLRHGELSLLTEDHTVVNRLVREGRITPQEAEIHPQRSILMRALGVDEQIDVDEATHEVRAGDRLLLCSDGLTGMVGESEILAILGGEEDPQRAADRLVEVANEAGGADNITAVVIDVLDEAPEEAAPSPTRAAAIPVTKEHTAADEPVPAGATGPAATREAAPPPPPAPPPRTARPVDGFAPTGRRERRWPRRLVLWVLLPLILIAGGLFAVKRLYVDDQWYVGAADGNVAIYRGIPARPLGLELSTVVRQTAIPADEVTGFPLYQELDAGITADDRDHAERIVADMTRLVEEMRERTQRSPGG
jgi:serine/threonine protein phosphatase PrpC